MNKNIWINHEQLLKELYPVLPADDLVKSLPFTKAQIKTAAAKLKLTKKGRLSSWKYEHEIKLIEIYSDVTNAKLAVMFGKSECTISGAAFKLRLKKSEEFMRMHAKKGQFKPGTVPPNKCLRQVDYMSPEMIERTKATRFKKGEPNHNSLYDGAIRIRKAHKDRPGDKDHYFIRISKGNWVALQIHNWEKINGPVPKDYLLACKDGDTLNCDPSNWELLTRAENAIRNAGHKNLKDTYVAGLLAKRGRTKVDKDLREAFMEHPKLIELKRNSLLLNREINENANRK